MEGDTLTPRRSSFWRVARRTPDSLLNAAEAIRYITGCYRSGLLVICIPLVVGGLAMLSAVPGAELD